MWPATRVNCTIKTSRSFWQNPTTHSETQKGGLSETPPFCPLSGQLTRLCTHCHTLDAAS